MQFAMDLSDRENLHVEDLEEQGRQGLDHTSHTKIDDKVIPNPD